LRPDSRDKLLVNGINVIFIRHKKEDERKWRKMGP